MSIREGEEEVVVVSNNDDNGTVLLLRAGHGSGNDENSNNGTLILTQPQARDNKMNKNNHCQSQIRSAAYLFAFCAALNSCNLGYDLGVSTNAGPKIQQDFGLSNGQLELFLGSLNFWSIFGALISPHVTDQWGRRATFRVAALGFLAGCACQAMAPNFVVLMVGRFVVGIGVGIGEAIDPIYIAEIAPKSIRGELVSWAEAGVAVGVVLGFSSSLLFLTKILQVPNPAQQEWRIMLAMGAVLPMVMLALLAGQVMPESPRWLLSKKRQTEARHVLQQIYPTTTEMMNNRDENEGGEEDDRDKYDPQQEDNAIVDRVVQEIEDSLALEQEAATAVGWEAILWFPSPAIRRMLLVGVELAIIQQAVGIDSVMFYLLFVIRQSGIQSEITQVLALILLGTVKLVFVFVGAKLFDRAGRRPLLFLSLVGCAASLIFVSILFANSKSTWSKILTVVGLALYLAFFSTGLGPGNWVVVSEVFATSIRAKAMSVAVLPNRITATIMASSFLSLAHLLSWPGFFLVLAGICLLSALFLFVYLPETKGRSLEEMSLYFAEITGDRSILDVEERLERKRRGGGADNSEENKNAVGGFPPNQIDGQDGHCPHAVLMEMTLA